MIHVTVSYGSGDRKAPTISDNLIPDRLTAITRARQELAAHTYIVMSRTLSLPHDPNGDVGGSFTEEFVYQPLGIYGNHVITSRKMTFTPTSASDEVSIEQYREMVL